MTIHIGPLSNPKNPSITEVDQAMAQVRTQLGGGWGAVKLSGIWVVWATRGTPLSGDRSKGQPLRRSFVQALADATGHDVVLID